MAVSKLFGASIKRREDPRLITGQATYTDDLQLPGMLHAQIVRSPHAHARIVRVDAAAARRHPGVVAVYTGKDLAGKLNPIPTAWLVPNADLKTPPHPALAVDVVRYVGDGFAVVVAESLYAARDAAALVQVQYAHLPAVVDQEQAVRDGAPQVHADVPRNVAFTWRVAGGDADQAFAEAKRDGVVVTQRFVNQRLIPNAMETRGVVARYNSGAGELTVWYTTQNPHIARFLMSVVTGIPEQKVRVIAPEVGGGFGSKIPFYADEAVVVFCARETGHPVKWVEDRRENYVATIHGRDHITDLEIAARKDGTITALRGKTWANLGAYLSTAAPGVPTILHGLILTGCYAIPNLSYEVLGVFTNTSPVDAYRGAGRPEATYLIERMVDLVAGALKMDPADVRRRNFIKREQFPYTTVEGLTYDSGDYHPALSKALELIGYEKIRDFQKQGPKDNRYLGVGLSTYVEICRLGRLPGRAVGERHGASPPDRQGDRVHRRVAARAGGGDDVRADRRRGAWPADRRHRRGARRHRRDRDGVGDLREPHDGRRWRRDRTRRAPGEGEGGEDRGTHARGVRGGHHVRPGPFLCQGEPGPVEDDPGGHARGVPCVEPAGGRRTVARGVGVLRSVELHLPVRDAYCRGQGQRGYRRGRVAALRGRRRLRPGHQSADRRRAGPRRARTGDCAGPVGGCRLQPRGAVVDRFHDGLRGAEGAHVPDVHDRAHRDAVAAQPARREGRGGNRHDREHAGRRQRGARRAAPPRRHTPGHAADAAADLERDSRNDPEVTTA